MPNTPRDIADPKLVANLYVQRYRHYAECRVDGHKMQASPPEWRAERDDMTEGWTRRRQCERCHSTTTDVYDRNWSQLRERRWTRPPGWDAYGVNRPMITLRHLLDALGGTEEAEVPRARR